MTHATSLLSVRPGRERAHTHIGWLDSRHSFSFGSHYDPANIGFGPLRVINDDWIAPGAGFGEHPHEDMEILTWVLQGSVRHGDNLGHMQLLKPGELQAMSAGTGIRHSEFNGSDTDKLHLLQIWIEPRERGLAPRYDQRAFDPAKRDGQWDTLASGLGHATAMPIAQDAELRVADLQANASIDVHVAAGRQAYVHVAFGRVAVEGVELVEGDAFTVSAAGTWTLEAHESSQLLWFDLP